MEIFGGFMAMTSIIMLFLAVVWLVMPFVVFAIKGRQDKTIDMLEDMKLQLNKLESELSSIRRDSAEKIIEEKNCNPEV